MRHRLRDRRGASRAGVSAVLAAGMLLLAACADSLPLGTPEGPPRLEEDRAIMADGTALPLRRWAAGQQGSGPQAVVLALHGFNDYSNAFSEVGEFWADNGIAAYAYDQRGFGETSRPGLWGGRTALMSDAASVLWLLHRRYPDTPIYVLGVSMGGAVAAALVTETAAWARTPPLDGVVLVAPAIWSREIMPWYQRAALDVARAVAPGWRLSPAGLDIQASDNIEMLRALSRDPLVLRESRVDTLEGLVGLMGLAYDRAQQLPEQTLILYGDNEEVVPLEAVDRMLERLPETGPNGPTVAFYPRGWHMLLRDLARETVWGDIASWMKNPEGGPLPSGADLRGRARLEAVRAERAEVAEADQEARARAAYAGQETPDRAKE